MTKEAVLDRLNPLRLAQGVFLAMVVSAGGYMVADGVVNKDCPEVVRSVIAGEQKPPKQASEDFHTLLEVTGGLLLEEIGLLGFKKRWIKRYLKFSSSDSSSRSILLS